MRQTKIPLRPQRIVGARRIHPGGPWGSGRYRWRSGSQKDEYQLPVHLSRVHSPAPGAAPGGGSQGAPGRALGGPTGHRGPLGAVRRLGEPIRPLPSVVTSRTALQRA